MNVDFPRAAPQNRRRRRTRRSQNMNIVRHILACANAALVVMCLCLSIGNRDGLVFLISVFLFGWVATAMWLRSRWVMLPGILLVAIFAVAAVMFSLAVLWPADQVLKLIAGCAGLVVLEIASMAVTVVASRATQQAAAETVLE